MAKGKNINGNGDGSYTIIGRGVVARPTLIKEVKEGKHPDTHVYKRNGVEYARNNPNNNVPDNIND
ncbi:DUF3892 domain-containing protein [Photobacterium carnosum]|uniref:DUF3892 domain-containing protein n=1 Tax=Photobacterium carnosum TaxID=2023717 RepID=UPI00242A6F03|nr:DUF3892 domain-containing protein [Photobacterium carnosum]